MQCHEQIIAVTRENALLHALEPKKKLTWDPITYEIKSGREYNIRNEGGPPSWWI
jgi:hypothetical protein